MPVGVQWWVLWYAPGNPMQVDACIVCVYVQLNGVSSRAFIRHVAWLLFGLQPQDAAVVGSDPGHLGVGGPGQEASDAAFADSLRLIHLQKLERASLRSRKDQVGM